MLWCGNEDGLAWEAMFYIGRMWRPDGGSSFRSYIRSWAKYEARRLHRGGGRDNSFSQRQYAILTNAQRTFGAPHQRNDLALDEVLIDQTCLPEFGQDDIEEMSRALRKLSKRDRMVLQARFFDGRTLQSLASEWAVSIERIRQIQKRALVRARKHIEAGRAALRVATIGLTA